MIGRPLTTERFKKYFHNSFDLTNFSIRYARDSVMSGQEDNLDKILNGIAKEVEKEHLKKTEKSQ